MIRRPLDRRFAALLQQGVKTTTIRERAWPFGVPIQLYSWTGAPYRSKTEPVAVVDVASARIIVIDCSANVVWYDYNTFGLDRPLHETEGFASRAEMDAWFRRLVGDGRSRSMWLMELRVVDASREA